MDIFALLFALFFTQDALPCPATTEQPPKCTQALVGPAAVIHPSEE